MPREEASTPSLQVARSTTGLDEPEPGAGHALSAGLATGDDGFVAPQRGDGGEDGAPVAVEERDDAPQGEVLSGEAGVDRLFWPGRRRRTAGRSSAWLLAPGALAGGQCTEVAVGWYSMSRWRIPASSSRSW